MRNIQKRQHLVLWDGECGFCRRSIHWLERHARHNALRFETSQTADISPQLRAACQKALYVIKTDGTILHGGKAAMFCGEFTRWHQLARIGQWPIFLPFVNLGYKLIAHNRMLVSRFLFTRE